MRSLSLSLLPKWTRQSLVCAAVLIGIGSIWLCRKESLQNSSFGEVYAEWRKKPDPQQTQKWKEVLRKTPSLRRAFRAELAQLLLVEGEHAAAARIAHGAIEELHAISPDHAEYARITLLIQQGLKEQALHRSLALQTRMQNKDSVLYRRNLLRIRSLQENY
jgi:hypothetical protein